MKAEFLADAACPSCGKAGFVSRVSRPETVSIRDLDMNVYRTFRVCANCHAEFENSNDEDWKLDAYAAYREIKGMVTPNAIRDWRKEYDLTQPEVSRLLGWGEATLGRYENGALQSDAHNKALARLMEVDGLAQALEANPGAISDAKKAFILDKLSVPLTIQRARQMLMTVASSPRPSALNGCRLFSVEKTAGLVSFIADAGEFKTKLNKLMFYTDFLSFFKHGRSITGLRYARIPYGPVPDKYGTIFSSLAEMGVLIIEPWEAGECSGEIVRSSRVAGLSILSEEERQVATLVRDYFSGWTSTKIKDFSHKEKAWIEVPTGSPISYDYAAHLQIRGLVPRASYREHSEFC
ncbi:hypothetical protein TSH58p_03630 [Azospirillum sp. TSH58]|uniref:type II TA system antitoxin MqsA family protein n=1 Tax=Azospirillum sp. TSH58 TaxID=664962 RepID=UPI000D6031B3|nr:type II TA system antitoxin MqsA family protein [Azospirillum sp. TSH58]AWJ82688.1 hypothetical protein TSH58p_03630 [Azospirillum sp. TSH58]